MVAVRLMMLWEFTAIKNTIGSLTIVTPINFKKRSIGSMSVDVEEV